ncbi:MAG: thioredoxin-disulfide reductase, partial [Sphingomonadales bacterium]
VSACATCDGFFFRGKKVAVIGGGNTAVEEALYLTNHSDDVTLVHRRDELRSEKILQERLFKSDKISTLWNKTVERFVAGEDGGLNHLVLKDTKTGEESTLEVDGAFVAIGHAPATEVFKGKLPMDAGGYLLTEPGSPKTEIPGVFAAGDVTDHTYRQAVTAAGMGCMAALDAERFLATLDFAAKQTEAAE